MNKTNTRRYLLIATLIIALLLGSNLSVTTIADETIAELEVVNGVPNAEVYSVGTITLTVEEIGGRYYLDAECTITNMIVSDNRPYHEGYSFALKIEYSRKIGGAQYQHDPNKDRKLSGSVPQHDQVDLTHYMHNQWTLNDLGPLYSDQEWRAYGEAKKGTSVLSVDTDYFTLHLDGELPEEFEFDAGNIVRITPITVADLVVYALDMEGVTIEWPTSNEVKITSDYQGADITWDGDECTVDLYG